MGEVRLSERQRDALSYALESVKMTEGSEVYLFGSRTDPYSAGGDVDILVYSSCRDPYGLARAIRRAYRQRLDGRIDVIVVDPAHEDA